MSVWNVIRENFHTKHSVLTAPDEHMPYIIQLHIMSIRWAYYEQMKQQNIWSVNMTMKQKTLSLQHLDLRAAGVIGRWPIELENDRGRWSGLVDDKNYQWLTTVDWQATGTTNDRRRWTGRRQELPIIDNGGLVDDKNYQWLTTVDW